MGSTNVYGYPSLSLLKRRKGDVTNHLIKKRNDNSVSISSLNYNSVSTTLSSAKEAVDLLHYGHQTQLSDNMTWFIMLISAYLIQYKIFRLFVSNVPHPFRSELTKPSIKLSDQFLLNNSSNKLRLSL
jgi:hypothetical protein